MSIKSRERNKSSKQEAIVQKPRSSGAYRIIAGLAILTGLGIGANYYHTRQNSAIAVAENKRQQMFDGFFKEMNLPYATKIVYDPTGELLTQEQLRLSKEVMPDVTPEQISVRYGYSTPNNNGDYEASTPDLANSNGKGEKSKIFFGRKIFEDPKYAKLTQDDLKVIIKHEHRHATQHAKGYVGIDSNWYLDNQLSGNLDGRIYSMACELDANAEELRVVDAGAPHSKALMDNLLENLCTNLLPSQFGAQMNDVSRTFYNTILEANRPILNKYQKEIGIKMKEMHAKYGTH